MRLYSADFVLPISSEPISDGALLVEGERIVAVGTPKNLRETHEISAEERFPGAAIIPGFVNCHSHLELTALRGALDDLDHDFPAWLLKLTDLRANVLNDRDIADSAVAGALEGAKAGVTCFGDIGRWGRAGLDALRSAGLRGVLYQETGFSPSDETAKDDFNALLEELSALGEDSDERVEVGVSPHSPYTVSRALFGLIAGHSAETGRKVTIHAAESEAEQELLKSGKGFFADVFRGFGIKWDPPRKRAVEYLYDTGILYAAPLLAHCTTADETEMSLMASSGSKVAHCPKSNAKFGHGIAPLKEFADRGISVGLGTDSMVSNNLCDMFEEARFAALASRIRDPKQKFISPSEALRLATLGGAEALGISDRAGSLEAGKFADFAVVSIEEVSRMPVHDVNSALLFASRASDVLLTVVAGEKVYSNGMSPLIDEERLKKRLAEISGKVRASNAAAQL